MHLALNNLQGLIYHKTQQTKPSKYIQKVIQITYDGVTDKFSNQQKC